MESLEHVLWSPHNMSHGVLATCPMESFKRVPWSPTTCPMEPYNMSHGALQHVPCSAKAQPMLSQCPAYAQPISSICSANAQPMSAKSPCSRCSANVQPTLSQCSAYALLPNQCLANASASPANAQPMPKGASQLKLVH